MNDLKYNIVKLKKMKTVSAIVFRSCINHSDMVPKDAEVISAGYCEIGIVRIKVYGGSESLGVESRQEDETHIYNTLNKIHSYTEF